MIRYRCRCGLAANISAEGSRNRYVCSRCRRKWKIPRRVRRRCSTCGKPTYRLRSQSAEEGLCDHCHGGGPGGRPGAGKVAPADGAGADKVASADGPGADKVAPVGRPDGRARRERQKKPAARFRMIPLDQIRTNRFQPRGYPDADGKAIGRLRDSIRQLGVIVPILVNRDRQGFTLVAGQRRLIASRQLGLPAIPALVHELTFSEMLQMACMENLHRRALTPVEKVQTMQWILEERPTLTWKELAERFGLDPVRIEGERRLLQLPVVVREAIAKRMISAREALGLKSVTDRDELLAEIKRSYRRRRARSSSPMRVGSTKRRVSDSAPCEGPPAVSLASSENWIDAVTRAVCARLAADQRGPEKRFERSVFPPLLREHSRELREQSSGDS